MISSSDVLRWFRSLAPGARLDLITCLVELLVPLELRFIGTLIEDLARKDYYFLKPVETQGNDPGCLETLTDLDDSSVRSILILSVALLGSSNYAAAAKIFRLVSNYCVRKLEDDIHLLYVMISLHPAFSFQQQSMVRERINEKLANAGKSCFLEQLQEPPTASTSYDKESQTEHCSDLVMPPTTTPSSLNHLSNNHSEDFARNRLQELLFGASLRLPDDKHYTHPSLHTLDTTGVLDFSIGCIRNIEVKGSQRRGFDNQYEFIFETRWSNGSKTNVTKSLFDLQTFHSKLIGLISGFNETSRQKYSFSFPDLMGPIELQDLLPRVMDYVNRIRSLPPLLLQNALVCEFFARHSPMPISSSSSCYFPFSDTSSTTGGDQPGSARQGLAYSSASTSSIYHPLAMTPRDKNNNNNNSSVENPFSDLFKNGLTTSAGNSELSLTYSTANTTESSDNDEGIRENVQQQRARTRTDTTTPTFAGDSCASESMRSTRSNSITSTSGDPSVGLTDVKRQQDYPIRCGSIGSIPTQTTSSHDSGMSRSLRHRLLDTRMTQSAEFIASGGRDPHAISNRSDDAKSTPDSQVPTQPTAGTPLLDRVFAAAQLQQTFQDHFRSLGRGDPTIHLSKLLKRSHLLMPDEALEAFNFKALKNLTNEEILRFKLKRSEKEFLRAARDCLRSNASPINGYRSPSQPRSDQITLRDSAPRTSHNHEEHIGDTHIATSTGYIALPGFDQTAPSPSAKSENVGSAAAINQQRPILLNSDDTTQSSTVNLTKPPHLRHSHPVPKSGESGVVDSSNAVPPHVILDPSNPHRPGYPSIIPYTSPSHGHFVINPTEHQSTAAHFCPNQNLPGAPPPEGVDKALYVTASSKTPLSGIFPTNNVKYVPISSHSDYFATPQHQPRVYLASEDQTTQHRYLYHHPQAQHFPQQPAGFQNTAGKHISHSNIYPHIPNNNMRYLESRTVEGQDNNQLYDGDCSAPNFIDHANRGGQQQQVQHTYPLQNFGHGNHQTSIAPAAQYPVTMHANTPDPNVRVSMQTSTVVPVFEKEFCKLSVSNRDLRLAEDICSPPQSSSSSELTNTLSPGTSDPAAAAAAVAATSGTAVTSTEVHEPKFYVGKHIADSTRVSADIKQPPISMLPPVAANNCSSQDRTRQRKVSKVNSLSSCSKPSKIIMNTTTLVDDSRCNSLPPIMSSTDNNRAQFRNAEPDTVQSEGQRITTSPKTSPPTFQYQQLVRKGGRSNNSPKTKPLLRKTSLPITEALSTHPMFLNTQQPPDYSHTNTLPYMVLSMPPPPLPRHAGPHASNVPYLMPHPVYPVLPVTHNTASSRFVGPHIPVSSNLQPSISTINSHVHSLRAPHTQTSSMPNLVVSDCRNAITGEVYHDQVATSGTTRPSAASPVMSSRLKSCIELNPIHPRSNSLHSYLKTAPPTRTSSSNPTVNQSRDAVPLTVTHCNAANIVSSGPVSLDSLMDVSSVKTIASAPGSVIAVINPQVVCACGSCDFCLTGLRHHDDQGNASRFKDIPPGFETSDFVNSVAGSGYRIPRENEGQLSASVSSPQFKSQTVLGGVKIADSEPLDGKENLNQPNAMMHGMQQHPSNIIPESPSMDALTHAVVSRVQYEEPSEVSERPATRLDNYLTTSSPSGGEPYDGLPAEQHQQQQYQVLLNDPCIVTHGYAVLPGATSVSFDSGNPQEPPHFEQPYHQPNPDTSREAVPTDNPMRRVQGPYQYPRDEQVHAYFMHHPQAAELTRDQSVPGYRTYFPAPGQKYVVCDNKPIDSVLASQHNESTDVEQPLLSLGHDRLQPKHEVRSHTEHDNTDQVPPQHFQVPANYTNIQPRVTTYYPVNQIGYVPQQGMNNDAASDISNNMVYTLGTYGTENPMFVNYPTAHLVHQLKPSQLKADQAEASEPNLSYITGDGRNLAANQLFHKIHYSPGAGDNSQLGLHHPASMSMVSIPATSTAYLYPQQVISSDSGHYPSLTILTDDSSLHQQHDSSRLPQGPVSAVTYNSGASFQPKLGPTSFPGNHIPHSSALYQHVPDISAPEHPNNTEPMLTSGPIERFNPSIRFHQQHHDPNNNTKTQTNQSSSADYASPTSPVLLQSHPGTNMAYVSQQPLSSSSTMPRTQPFNLVHPYGYDIDTQPQQIMQLDQDSNPHHNNTPEIYLSPSKFVEHQHQSGSLMPQSGHNPHISPSVPQYGTVEDYNGGGEENKVNVDRLMAHYAEAGHHPSHVSHYPGNNNMQISSDMGNVDHGYVQSPTQSQYDPHGSVTCCNCGNIGHGIEMCAEHTIDEMTASDRGSQPVDMNLNEQLKLDYEPVFDRFDGETTD